MSTQVELWRVSTPEGVFEADLETLKQWISEGAVLATDKVSKGNLNWIEAGRAPVLRSAFCLGLADTPAATAKQEPDLVQYPDHALPEPIQATERLTSSQNVVRTKRTNVCENHRELAAKYICRVCASTFCETCPRFVNKIALCPSCGDLCKLFHEERSKAVL